MVSFISRLKRGRNRRAEKSEKSENGQKNDGSAASSMLTLVPSTGHVELPPPEQVTSSTTDPALSLHRPATWDTAARAKNGPTAVRRSTESSSANYRTQSEYRENGLQTPGRNPPNDSQSDTAPSLWDRAYTALKTSHPRLVGKYEVLLSRELPETGSNPPTLSGDPPDQTDESLDETANRIKANPKERRAQLDTIIESGLQRMDSRKFKWHLGGYDVMLQDQMAGMVQKFQDYVSGAVRVSPEASLAWAGVCLILPVLTSHSVAEQANRDGFTYVTSRMRYYVALEPLLWPKNQNADAADPQILKEFQAHIVDLYQHILDFQFRSVLRFYRGRLGSFGLDLIGHEDWGVMLSKVQELESIVEKDSTKINNSVSRQALEKLSETTKGSLETMQQLLSVTQQQLQLQQEGLHVQKELAKDVHEILIESRNTDQVAIDLEIVEDASCDSEANQNIPLCQQGTRVGILKQITTWANDVNSETIFWLSGPAGTGKSTIARSLAHFLTDTGQLGASYFFKRAETNRNGTALFFPTIANQLIKTIPKFRTYLGKSLEKLENTKIEKKSLEEQFKTLIHSPLSEILPDESGILTRVIVIDALDECEQPDHISRFLSLFSQLQKLSTVRLHVFLTSRLEHQIASAFEELDGTPYRKLALHQEFYDETKADIAAFLEARFAAIKAKCKITKDPWPDPEDLHRLVSLATNPSPLFIYAATLCRFTYDGTGRSKPVRQLKLWLKKCDSHASQLNQIYLPILHQVFFGSHEEGQKPQPLSSEDRSQVMQMLGSITLLASPLSARDLAVLLDIDEDDVDHWLRNLHAVLNVPRDPNAPVRLLHKSFGDFLLGHEGTGTDSFRINAAETHAMLASKCIQRMLSDNGLRKNICNVREPGKPRSEIGKDVVAKNIPRDLNYACLYWVFHLQQGGRRITDGDEVYAFLQQHFLHWLEALSLIGKICESNVLIGILQSLTATDKSTDLSRFLHDARCFILQNRGIFDMAPLQLYSSAIVFAPETSVIRRVFKGQKPTWIRRLPKMHSTWDPEVQKLEGHTDSIFSIAFSQQLLASTSGDDTVRLWNPATGEEVRKLKGHSDRVRTVTFSRDGQLLATASGDTTVRLWNPATGGELRKYEGHTDWVRAVAISPDCQLLASVSDDMTVRLWNLETGEELHKLEGHTDWVQNVMFSPDGQLLASVADDRTIRLWNPVTGEELRKLEGHTDRIWSVVFSPDGQLLASASGDSTARLWNPITGEELRKLEGHTGGLWAVAFSHDGQLLASASNDKTVRLWNPATGVELRKFEGHTDQAQGVAFSHDGQLLASASGDTTLRLWNLAMEGELHNLEGHTGQVSAVIFSHDGKLLASASSDSTVRLWNSATGEELHKFEGHTARVWAVVFSHDGQWLASVSDDSTVRLWNVITRRELHKFEGHSDWVRAVAFSQDSQLLASASDDRTVRLWNPTTGRELHKFEGHTDWIRDVAFSPDSRLLASASDDSTVRLWNLTTGEELHKLEGHISRVCAVTFSHDGQLLASASDDNTVRLWNPATGEELEKLNIDVAVGRLSFSKYEPYLETDRGFLRIQSTHSGILPSQSKPARDVFVKECWVTRDTENLLWLPSKYRPGCAAVHGSLVALGSPSGLVSILEFAF